MKERLIKLLEHCSCHYSPPCDRECAVCHNVEMHEKEIENIADHLLANGVIVPPCKIGDTVYSITECSCENIDGAYTECEFYGYGEDDRICAIPNGAKCPNQYRIMECYVTEGNILMFTRMCGETVFLTREQAEKALAERNKS